MRFIALLGLLFSSTLQADPLVDAIAKRKQEIFSQQKEALMKKREDEVRKEYLKQKYSRIKMIPSMAEPENEEGKDIGGGRMPASVTDYEAAPSLQHGKAPLTPSERYRLYKHRKIKKKHFWQQMDKAHHSEVLYDYPYEN